MHHLLSILIIAVSIAITFGLAVFVHEFGHMMFALLRGVGVESFAIGMGPKITSWKWKGIDFSLRWFPVGGFVKLAGRTPPAETAETAGATEGLATASDVEVDREAKPADEQGLTESVYDDLCALQDQGLLTKVLVFGGGVFMNLVTAVLAIALLAVLGYKQDLIRFKIESVAPDSLAARDGLQTGDQVVALNGRPITYLQDFNKDVLKDYGANPKGLTTLVRDKLGLPPVRQERPVALTLTVERNGTRHDIKLLPMTYSQIADWLDGVTVFVPPLVGNVVPNYPADRAGLKQGDVIKAIDGQPVQSWTEMNRLIAPRAGQPVTLTVDRQGKTFNVTLTPKEDVLENRKGLIGITNGSLEHRTERLANPLKALAVAPFDAYSRLKGILSLNKRFFAHATFKDVRENVGGPIAIAAITAKRATAGLRDLIDWFIMLNLLLLIFNLLPLPVLDGGFIVLSFIEAVIRRPVPPKVLGPIYTVFVICFIVLMVLISVQDVINWVPIKR